ncbi:anti-sigma factor antagonist [Leptolyngbya sp. NIES-3755]|nr:anti-sigma factor antagonist [Leptolyngbya sp. NIES-3755]
MSEFRDKRSGCDFEKIGVGERMTLVEQYEEVVLQPQGRLDTVGGEALQQQWATLAPRRYKVWIIDMSRIEFIDSSGLVALVTGLKAATEMGTKMILCGLRPSARLVFEITQLDRAFAIFENYEAITRSFGRTQEVLQAV